MISSYDVEERRKNKMKSDDRVLVLKVIEGKKAISSTGSIDPRVFSGENNLHGFYNNYSGMWEMKYDVGAVPGALKNKFTSFDLLLTYARDYFKQRNVEIVSIQE